MSTNNDTISKTLLVTISLCVVCAVLVSTAAVALKPLQEANKALDMKTNILRVAGISTAGQDVNQLFEERIDARVIDLKTNAWADDIDPTKLDERKAVKDPASSITLTGDTDEAGIQRHSRYKTAYLIKDGDEIKTLLLPIRGKGLWSTLYGFIALEGDLNTVSGFGFYEHAETPGLGGEVDNPSWKAKWEGKQVYEENPMDPQLQVIKGQVGPDTRNAEHKVDGLAGATLTSNGVTNTVQFWLGENGYAPFLAKLRSGEV